MNPRNAAEFILRAQSPKDLVKPRNAAEFILRAQSPKDLVNPRNAAEFIRRQNVQVTLRIWRQAGPDKPGGFTDYGVGELSPDMSFLEVLDILNLRLVSEGKEPVAFDHDCREGICGSCSCVINGDPHGPERAVPHANFICGDLRMVTPSWWNRGVERRFPSSEILWLIAQPWTGSWKLAAMFRSTQEVPLRPMPRRLEPTQQRMPWTVQPVLAVEPA